MVLALLTGRVPSVRAKPRATEGADHSDRAYELENAGKPAEALAEYRAAIRLAPRGNGDLYWRAGEMELRLGHPKRAIPLLERASHMGIEAGGCEILALARAYEEVGQLKRAMYVLEREASEYPNFIRVPLELAALLARHGQCGAARQKLAEAETSRAISVEEIRPWAEAARNDVKANCSKVPPSNPESQRPGLPPRR